MLISHSSTNMTPKSVVFIFLAFLPNLVIGSLQSGLLFVVGTAGTDPAEPDKAGSSEILDLSGQFRICPSVAKYPNRRGAVGTYINSK